MNAPALRSVSLEDRYDLGADRIFLSGTQALVRLALVQKARDRAAGLRTAGFISGYRGSPLGGLDQELWRARRHLEAHDIRFVPGLNEELAATAVWGAQMAGMNPRRRFDGVFGLWYGKGPGLDRAMDVLKHANAAGTSRHGGVLAIVGDDHGAKSSTLPHQSDHNFMAAFVPFLSPASVHEIVELGLLGLAMSRFAGTWVGFKATADTVETSATVDTAAERREIVFPDFEFPEGGVHIRPNDIWREEDTRLQRFKGFAAQAFARANRIDRLVWDSPRARFGIITTGKAYTDTMEALFRMGLDARVAADIGLRVYKVGMPWPLEPEGVRAFATGLEEILVVEEKREFIEHQMKWQLYNWREDVRPVVVGKHDEQGNWLLSPDNELTPGQIARVIAARIARFHSTDRVREALAYFERREAALAGFTPPVRRTPWFCSGCPHNSSTRVPEGSRALAGIGCHIMALWMDRAQTFTQMGGEGVTWVGEAPFVDEPHVFANLGDGTYAHSGILAIRQAIAAGVPITYKILYNDAVAMTGGQPVEGGLSVGMIARQMLAEGAAKVVVLAEDPERYRPGEIPPDVRVLPRDQLDPVSRELRDTPGVTVIIYDQTCAAEKRRRRKRGLMPEPDRRVVINPEVCEGCGDCSVQSNCISIEPLATDFGRKRRINQSSCNKDYSCLKGFCPSFVTVRGAELRRPEAYALPLADLPEPEPPPLGHDHSILITGIGGTGVLTVAALLGMAAHVAGLASTTADMAGLAQKGGAVWSTVRIARRNDDLLSPRIITGGADLLLACDSIVAVDRPALDMVSTERTTAVANADIAPTADFVRHRDADFRGALVRRQLERSTRTQHFVAAERLATRLLGDAIGANMILLGFALQKGLIPLPLAALDRAIELNDVAVEFNRRALALGRLLAHDPARVEALLAPPERPRTLDDALALRVRSIQDWGSVALARRYEALVARVRAAEERIAPGSTALTEAVLRAGHKLACVKDEYEVARLHLAHLEPLLGQQFRTWRGLVFHLSPPLLARIDPATGRPRKFAIPGWLALPTFRLLRALRPLRGTAFDPFGHTAERRAERAAFAAYEAEVDRLLQGLTSGRLPLAVAIAALPLDVRGFGPVKAEAEARAAARRVELWARWDASEPLRKAA
ncbi:MAG: indolepyruvate ferredoxin oxidoreductase family protein [Sphingomonadaceae bacterium]|uniref:indolepyruvate ferredoxin oxidoreductase family protein n=1 Tax=Thermaurantiacus sp. TaxID=2820283 RepID=UPI00298ED110|nr:indolepyruvate ferredoxin oxidoreductase family protein [Thermaurantiacus sp.]MCS6986380.1 indolepyruvate ferredoxin oxidoreductase family protein [Sphingomonadaceae bacterium]MDW8414358.1 indolepyruvate ferredoxin oxidoreductase family protein [Thermaurantiacus sp.]